MKNVKQDCELPEEPTVQPISSRDQEPPSRSPSFDRYSWVVRRTTEALERSNQALRGMRADHRRLREQMAGLRHLCVAAAANPRTRPWHVVLVDPGARSLDCLNVVSQLMRVSRGTARRLCDGAPCLLLSTSDAAAASGFESELKAIGATATVAVDATALIPGVDIPKPLRGSPH
jgi:hypothetical protein